MARNICLDCGYFLNCNLANKNITYCEKFTKAHRTITKIIRATTRRFRHRKNKKIKNSNRIF